MSNIIKKSVIMNIPFVNETMDEFMKKAVEPSCNKSEKCFIVTANPEIVMASKRDRKYEDILQNADYIVPDGNGILLAAKLNQITIKERIPGVELMERMLKFANQHGYSCFFLGGKEAVNQACVHNIKANYPNIKVAGRHHGYVDLHDKQVARQVIDANPDFVFVALGSPKQEQWIAAHQDQFSKGIFMGVGGSFDIFAGQVKRAPNFWIKLRLEWLYRLLQNPSRIKRIGPLFSFVWRALWRKE